jgi:large subunit ribosomal protein L17
MLSNMANSLLLHKRITTTLAKAKELRSFVEPLITRAKEDSTHNRREVFSDLKSKQVVTELFRDIIVKIGDRPGGYTRILKTGNRMGDNAEMCMIELVDYNENMLSTPKADTTKKRRARKPKATPETPAKVKEAKKVAAPAEVPAETPAEETAE